MGINCPPPPSLVEIGLIDLPKSGGGTPPELLIQMHVFWVLLDFALNPKTNPEFTIFSTNQQIISDAQFTCYDERLIYVGKYVFKICNSLNNSDDFLVDFKFIFEEGKILIFLSNVNTALNSLLSRGRPVVPLSRDKEETSVPLSRKVALSRPVGNPTTKLIWRL